MKDVYFIETNMICIVLLLMVMNRIRFRSQVVSSPQLILHRVVLSTTILCASDLVAGVCSGETFAGASIIVHLSNMVYFEMMTIIALVWCLYVFTRTGRMLPKKWRMVFCIPFFVMTAIIASNPVTHFLFTVNANNQYARGPGVLIHWFVTWFYMIYACVVSAIAIRKAETQGDRIAFSPLLNFMVAPIVAALLQMRFYGVSATQAGITISIMMIILKMQDGQILVDELTQINNRRAMWNYVERLIHKNVRAPLAVLMMDINRFKKINDGLGHAMGDLALQDTAKALQEACGQFQLPLFLCRYGGDEFVIVCDDVPEEKLQELADRIRKVVLETALRAERPYALEISVGISGGICDDLDDFRHHLRLADESMYDDKKKLNAVRTD